MTTEVKPTENPKKKKKRNDRKNEISVINYAKWNEERQPRYASTFLTSDFREHPRN